MNTAVQTKNELVVLIDKNGLDEKTNKNLKKHFVDYFEKAADWQKKADQLVIKGIDDIEGMQKARTGRLALKDIRVAADKKRKQLKEKANKYNSAVQGVFNFIEALIKPIEESLLKKEQYIQEQRARISAEKEKERLVELEPYNDFVHYVADLGGMEEEDYQKLLKGAKLLFKADEDEKKKARVAKEKTEKVARLHEQRKESILDYWAYLADDLKESNLGEMSEVKWTSLCKAVVGKKDAYDKKIKDEKAASEEARKKLLDKLEKQSKEQKKKDEAAEKEKKIQEVKDAAQKKIADKLKEKLKEKEAVEKKRLDAAKAAQEQIEKEEKAVKSAPDRTKLEALSASIQRIEIPTIEDKNCILIKEEVALRLSGIAEYIKFQLTEL